MAISTQKFLPGSKGVTKSVSQEKISSITLTSPDKKNVNTIRVRTIQIEQLLKGTLAADKKRLGDKKKDANTKRKEDLETNLEKKPDLKKKFTMPKILPRTGILDWIKNFITNILFGYFAVRLVEHLPALAGLFKGIVAVGEFIINWGGRILNGLVTFVDWGYKLYDGLRQFTDDIFGESGLKKFDAFMKGLNTFINAVLILGLAIARVAPAFLGRGGKGVKGRNVDIKGMRGQAGRTARGGTSSAAARRYTDKFGRRAAIKKFGKEGVQSLGGRYGRSGVTNLARKGVVKVLGKGGVKAASRILRPIVKNIPIIGGLLEFAIAWASGDPIGKAAFRGIGAGLGTWVGGALGTLVGGPIGTGIGMFIGGAGGSELGGVMYDAFFGGKKSPRKTQGYAKGGRVKKASRTIRPRIKRRKKTRRAPYIPPIKIDPGKDVGGEKKLEESPWWNPFGWGRGEEKKDEVNLLDYFKKYGDKFGKLGYFGPMATLGIKALVGQKPSDKEYDDAALGLSALTASSALGFAAGGKVDRASLQKDFIKKEFKKSFIPLVDEVVSDIQKNLGKAKPKGEGGKKKEGASSTPGGQKGYMSGPAGTSGDKLTMARNLMRDLGLTEAQAAGIVGNMAAESGVENGRPQGSRPGVKAPLVVDGKTGYGLVQWTSRGRQQGLWDFAKSKGHDMSKPLTMDLEYQYFLKEFQNSYGHVLNAIRESKNVKEASTIFMQQYEIPAGYKTEAKIMERYNASEPIYQNLSSGKGTVTEGVGEFIPDMKPDDKNKGASSGSKLAGDLGRYMDSKGLGSWGSGVHQHPEHPPWKRETGHRVGSLHYASQGGRAIDIGGWGPMRYAREGMSGTDDQTKIIAGIREWEKINGITKRAEFAHEGNDPTGGHDDHVHVAYHKGGEVLGRGERWAKLLGGEIVVDVDSAGPAKDLLLAINQASGRDGVMKAIKDYAPYEAIQSRMIPVPVERMVPVPIPSKSGGGVVVIGGGGGSDPFSSLALNA